MKTQLNFRPALSLLGGLLAALAVTSAQPQETRLPGDHPIAGPGPVHDSDATLSTGGALSVFRQATALEQVDGEAGNVELRGGGPDYLVRFAPDGVELTPALGSAVEHNMPLSFALEAVELGGVPLHGAIPLAAPTFEQRVVTYDHGAFLERYEVRPEGVEQSFVFHSLPALAGDLVVRGRIDTDLVPPPAGYRTDGLRFEAPGAGAVTIGAVTGIDAAGRTAAGGLHYANGVLELSLPASFVAQAELPLVLDPVIGSEFSPSGSGNNDLNPDVAYDGDNNQYLVVWQRQFSGTQIYVRAQRLTSTGSLIGSYMTITSAELCTNPTVAYVAATERFLIAWQQGPTPFGPWDIYARGAGSDGVLSGSSILVSDGTGASVDPDVGGDVASEFGTGTTDDEAVVVWTEIGAGIRAAQVTASPGISNPFAFAPVAVSTDPDDSNPAITKSYGEDWAGRHLIVWQRYYDTGPDHDIWARAVTKDGAIGSSEEIVVQSIGSDEEDPDVAGTGTKWRIVYEREEAMGDGDNDIYVQAASYPSFTLVVDPTMHKLAGDLNDDEVDPAVAYAGAKYLVAWCDDVAELNYDIYAVGLDPASCDICEVQFTIDVGSTYDGMVEMAAQLSGSPTAGDEVLMVWQSAATTLPFDGDIAAYRYEAIGAGGSLSFVGSGCGGGGKLSSSGSLATGNPDFAIELALADSGASLAALLIRATDLTFTCGSCTFLLPPGITFAQPMSAGQATQPLPLPCQADLVGASFYAQWAVLPTSSSPCTLFPKISFSDRRSITLGL